MTRITNPADKRITYVELSEKGRTLMEEIFPLHVNTISDCFSSLEEEELTQFVKTLAKINRKLDKQL